MGYVLVDRDALAGLLTKAWDMFQLLADEAGYEESNLLPDSELVVLAVQARLPIPGPLAPGTVPPAPIAEVYRDQGDPRVRCVDCGKVVFRSAEEAERVASLISASRQAMHAYRGPCGHHHVTRTRRNK